MKRLVISIVCLIILCGCSVKEASFKNEQITSADQLDGKTIAILTGSIYEDIIKDNYKDSNFIYVNSRPELLLTVRAHKADGFMVDSYIGKIFSIENDDILVLDDEYPEIHNGFCFSKNASQIREEFNAYLANCKENGYLDELKNKWVDNYSNDTKIQDVTFYGNRGTLNVITSSDAMPMSFIANGTYQGYEVELLYGFCTYAGYVPEISNADFNAVITGVASNKYDVAFTGITITEERKRSIDFSDPVFAYSAKMCVLKQETSKVSTGNKIIDFFNSFVNKFNKMFIEEDRWLLILDGIRVTCLITISSLLIGTILGFIVYLLCRKSGPVIKKVINRIAFIIDRIPTILILMFLFYIIFSSMPIKGEYVSIIGFSLIETFSIYSMLDNGINTIDKGQTEGALALGYTDNKTLFKFVLPQALKIIMPSYKNDVVSLIKTTSIVGYITVQDLTRVSDIIRSRTYEAFFPLFVSAVVYFLLAWLLSRIVEKIQKRILPSEKTKEQILKKYE